MAGSEGKMDSNDPQLLGEALINMVNKGMTPCDAADHIYDDQARNGWRFGYTPSAPEAARPALRTRLLPAPHPGYPGPESRSQ
jgi:hypothetical protein